MKTTFKLSRLFGAVAALLLLAAVPFTLTSCDDDDDTFTNTVTINGETRKISEAIVYSVAEQDGENFYANYVSFKSEDGGKDVICFYFSERYLGKTLDLTKDCAAYDEETGKLLFYTAVVCYSYDAEGNYIDGNKHWRTMYTDDGTTHESEFQWGTIYMNVSDKVFTVKLSCKTKEHSAGDERTINVSYSGKYTFYEED